MEQERIIDILPKRNKGKFASSFKTLSCTSNHFKIELREIKFIYVFKVVFTPRIPADNGQLRNQLLEKARMEISLAISIFLFKIRKPGVFRIYHLLLLTAFKSGN